MSQTTLHQTSQSNLTAALSPRVGSLLVAAISLIAAGAVAAGTPYALVLGSAGFGLFALASVVGSAALKQKRAQAALIGAVSQFVENDASPSFTTDADGVIGYNNAAAAERFGDNAGNTLATALNGLFASPGAVLHRLQNRASLKRAAREDVVLRRGHLRLSVHQIGAEGYLWRLEDIAGRSAAARGADGISLPMLNVSKSDTVLFMNEAMRRLIGGRESTLDKIVN
ncbi:MAG: hybrid sensor histidine kinase/response regulator, partial [Alphaproteobacteria bacterium]|nr:hybrid sensor histidine kinase/response regulator [Alphaproteobacteria bacterium]